MSDKTLLSVGTLLRARWRDPAPVMETWTIYRYPRDYPEHYVLRRWVILSSGGEPIPDAAPAALGTDLLTVRGRVPPGLVCLGREPGDDPVIVETWV